MGIQVVGTAQVMCSFGVAPAALTVVPMGLPVQAGGQMAATIQDFKPNVNIMPFGMCTSPSNPTVAAATAAALGVLTPMPCIPATTAPWAPGAANVLLANMPALDDTSTLMCMWGGVIKVNFAGQATEQIP